MGAVPVDMVDIEGGFVAAVAAYSANMAITAQDGRSDLGPSRDAVSPRSPKAFANIPRRPSIFPISLQPAHHRIPSPGAKFAKFSIVTTPENILLNLLRCEMD